MTTISNRAPFTGLLAVRLQPNWLKPNREKAHEWPDGFSGYTEPVLKDGPITAARKAP